jgi:hypothetical protein
MVDPNKNKIKTRLEIIGLSIALLYSTQSYQLPLQKPSYRMARVAEDQLVTSKRVEPFSEIPTNHLDQIGSRGGCVFRV